MPTYEYRCRACGTTVTTNERGDSVSCSCGHAARRIFASVNVNAASARHKGRWDPVVGQYVESDREFRTLLRQGQEAESIKLGREVVLETVDARDTEGLAELHREPIEHRIEQAENTAKALRDSGTQ